MGRSSTELEVAKDTLSLGWHNLGSACGASWRYHLQSTVVVSLLSGGFFGRARWSVIEFSVYIPCGYDECILSLNIGDCSQLLSIASESCETS